MDLTEENSVSSDAEVLLAEWHCDADLWARFRAVERFDARALLARNVAAVSLVSTPVLLSLTWLGYWRGAFGPRLGQAIVALLVTTGAIVFLSAMILWLYRRQTAAVMNTPTGDVSLGLDGLTINSQRTDWRFGPPGLRRGGGLRFQNCRRYTVAGFEMLEINCAVTTRARYGSAIENDVRRSVPMPPDQISAADRAIERLNLRFRSAKSEWEGEI